MDQPYVSILIPLYNGINFLNECLNSIKSQSYTNWEVIVGVNGHINYSSTFLTAKAFESNKIKVIQYPTQGKPNTMNEMVKDASHDIICILDVDDYWHPNKLQSQINIKPLYDVVGTQCYYVKKGKITNQIPKIALGIVSEFFSSNPMINSSVMMNKADAWWDNVFIDDYDCWFRLHSREKSFYNISEPLVYHRIHTTSFFNGTNNNYVAELKNKWRNILKK
jgi:teichuronic acid biosynthesis glycosyltransferase TuaG